MKNKFTAHDRSRGTLLSSGARAFCPLPFESARNKRRHLHRRNIDLQLLGAAEDRQFTRHTDTFADKFLVQIVHARDRFVIEGNNDVVGANARMFCRAAFSMEATSTPVSAGK